MYPTNVIINTRFPAFHCWHDAPKEYEYLKSRHRHEFHVTVKIRVEHDDRDVEFIEAKDMLNEILHENYANTNMDFSCEMICKELHADLTFMKFNVVYVRVMEDGENGAEVYFA